MSPQSEFSNTLRILHSIDAMSDGFEELEFHLDREDLEHFIGNPARFFLRADEATQDRIWNVIEARLPKRKQLLAAE